jgi:phosphoglycolate phosphatase-like HAD superfamily hydrolase
MRPTVLLFDIDGTLIDSGGAGRRAMEGAFERYSGRRDACATIRFGGMTDRAILRAGLAGIGQPPTEALIDELLRIYLEVLVEEIEKTRSARIHAGVEVAIARAVEHRFAVGLGTGNVREGARLKLSRVGLFERFAFGGFGCDSEDRAELLRAGAVRGAASLGASPEDCRVVVIGDTPKDVAAARAIGAEPFGVGTGSFSAASLIESGALHAFESLEATNAIPALLAGVVDRGAVE